MAEKKTPLRKCTGCFEMKPKKELVRAVKSPQGEIEIDISGKKPGRGAYMCVNPECLLKARKAKRLERAFKCPIDDAVYDKMEEVIRENDR